jgi:alkylhydroperoxidase family enzyme
LFAIFDGDLDNSVYTHGAAPDEAFYDAIADGRDHAGFSERERLAIVYAEGMGLTPHEIAEDEDFWSRAKAVFSDNEIVDLTYSIAAWMGTGRALHALGLDSVCSFAPSARSLA